MPSRAVVVRLPLAMLLTTASAAASAGDLGFRFQDGKCVDAAGKAGFNPSFIGPCADLQGVTLGHLDMSGFDLRGSQLQGSDLRFSVLTGAKLDGANLSAANLNGVDLSEAVLTGAVLDHILLRNAKAYKTAFQGASLVGVDATGADAGYAMLTGVDLSGAKLVGTILTGASLQGAKLGGAALEGATLTDADLSGAALTGAFVRRAIAQRTRFATADLGGADLRDADMSDAVFEGAKLATAVFNKHTVFAFSREEAIALGMVARDQATFVGVQQGLKTADLDGWQICHTSLSSTKQPIPPIMAACTGAQIMLACRPVGSDTLTVAAYADHDVVWRDTGANRDGLSPGNGANFYFNDEYSMGFASADMTVTHNYCDYSTDRGAERLCWEADTGALLASDTRCGVVNNQANGDAAQWERVILMATGD